MAKHFYDKRCIFIFVFDYFACMLYLCTTCISVAHKARRRSQSDTQTHTHTVVNCHVGTENRITTEPSLQSHLEHFTQISNAVRQQYPQLVTYILLCFETNLPLPQPPEWWNYSTIHRGCGYFSDCKCAS